MKCAETSLKYYAMNPNAIIIVGKSLDTLLKRHLEQNGNIHDAYIDSMESMSVFYMMSLEKTYWTKETEDLRRKWQQSPEDIERNKNNVIIMR